MLANAVKRLPPSPKVGATGASKVGLSCNIFKNFTSCGCHCAAVRCVSGPEIVLFYTQGGPLVDAVLSLGPTPKNLPPGAAGPPPPKKFYPNLSKFLGARVEILIALYGDPQGSYVMKI